MLLGAMSGKTMPKFGCDFFIKVRELDIRNEHSHINICILKWILKGVST